MIFAFVVKQTIAKRHEEKSPLTDDFDRKNLLATVDNGNKCI